ncbi:MAG: N-acetyl-1-D-myo-inositol-2-amino-2-deoxy-alpha-D-glucopyranoside deacetylase [Mycobacteriaceae bacterium]|nr:N-acetyl-1-D-myo-inositol-2-amino-2-deoxy-alpha-D-glucopyranoside deacetylase [Mycobacteriaceae bacterium]MBV9638291.1 N-acetyl-1-D-myo-inositol-2-amino-2-deoxy-alpha-D-glucopyranoside deacetylase [Mycobacteriaceae bacterium]
MRSAADPPRLVFVHAHPDDECLTTGGTIAHYAARGADVHVVTCTLGEEGEIIGERYRLLGVDHADQLGGYRIHELTRALNALGLREPVFLGGPGRWRDSGMAGTPPRRHTRFIDAGRAAVDELARLIDRIRPHVVVGYDPKGGYGHPDHVHVHDLTTAAVSACAWKVPKLYWTVMSTAAIRTGLRALTQVPGGWHRPHPDDIAFGYADDEIHAVIDVAAHLDAKTDALTAHATQVVVAPDRRCCALSNNIALPILAQEHYVLAAGKPGPRDTRGWEADLLAGLNLG